MQDYKKGMKDALDEKARVSSRIRSGFSFLWILSLSFSLESANRETRGSQHLLPASVSLKNRKKLQEFPCGSSLLIVLVET